MIKIITKAMTAMIKKSNKKRAAVPSFRLTASNACPLLNWSFFIRMKPKQLFIDTIQQR